MAENIARLAGVTCAVAPAASSVWTPSSRSWIIFEFFKQRSMLHISLSSPQPGPLNSPALMVSPSRHLLRQGLLRGPQACPSQEPAQGPGRRGESGTVSGEQTHSLAVWLACCLPSQAGDSTEPSLMPTPRSTWGCPPFHPLAQLGTLGLWTLWAKRVPSAVL